MRQNTTSTQSSAYQNWLAEHDSVFASFDDDQLCKIITAGMIDSKNLTDENYVRFITWMRRYLYMQQAQYDLFTQGVIDKELWECNLNDMVGVFRFPGVRQYWEAGAKEHFKRGFVDMIEKTESFSPMLDWNSYEGFVATPFHRE